MDHVTFLRRARRYELSSLLVTGSCEDVGSRDPPNGLQLVLGTSTNAHVTDTLVMSNLGYYQLKAAPGAWELRLAPGPSSEVCRAEQPSAPRSTARSDQCPPSPATLAACHLPSPRPRQVYEVRADPALLSSGHSMQRAERRQINVEELVVMPSVQIVVSSFSGAHMLLLVRKQKGKERISILDDDKQQGASAADDGYLSSLSGGLSSWLGGSGKSVAVGGDETVHVFSLASGHLYERFLMIMMQSVVEKTKRCVGGWWRVGGLRWRRPRALVGGRRLSSPRPVCPLAAGRSSSGCSRISSLPT